MGETSFVCISATDLVIIKSGFDGCLCYVRFSSQLSKTIAISQTVFFFFSGMVEPCDCSLATSAGSIKCHRVPFQTNETAL